MAKQTINIGASPNDGTGTPLRTSFDYCNQNFTELYTATGPSGNNIVVPGNATITGDLTVRTAGLTVNANGVGVGVVGTLGAGNIQIGAGKYLGYSANSYITPEDNVQGARIKTSGNITLEANAATNFSIGGSTAMTLNSTGLGIGVSPTNKLNLATSSGSCIAGMTNGTNSVQYAVDSTGPYIYSVTPGAQSLRVLAPTGAVVFTIDGTGNVGVANGNVILGTSGKGIDFSATSSGSGTMTSELLNDYEEGTWTPVVKFGTTTATQSNTKTSYTKIGRQVTCFIETYITNLNGGTGNFELSGLPFTSMAMRSAQGDFLFQFMSASFPSGDKMAFINDSSTSFGILYFTGASGTALPLTDADFTTSSYLYARIVYFV